METRFLGKSGLQVSVLSMGTMTFGRDHPFFGKMGKVSGEDADRMIGMAVDAGVNLFDSADVYSAGQSEEVLGQALKPHRDNVLIATKAYARMGNGPNDLGNSRQHLVKAVEASLRRLQTDRIDLMQIHGQDLHTPVEETMRALDDLIGAGKVRYIGASNHSAWQMMKSLATSERLGLERFISHQVYYSLIARDVENEMVPMGLDQGLGMLVWSPLSGGLLSGKFRRDQPAPENTRTSALGAPGTIDDEHLYGVIDELVAISLERNAKPSQIALSWLLSKPGVSSVIVGARNEAQLAENLGAAAIILTANEVEKLDAASALPAPFPYWHQRQYAAERNPQPEPYIRRPDLIDEEKER
ncbi:MAG: aldo/keto reductase [Pseudomonadota bacterium]